MKPDKIGLGQAVNCTRVAFAERKDVENRDVLDLKSKCASVCEDVAVEGGLSPTHTTSELPPYAGHWCIET